MSWADATATKASRFADRVDAQGDPGPNGLPDVLDEARWGLEWMLKLHPAPDQLYHQVADDRDHIGFRLPQNEVADYGWGKGGARVVYFADGRPQGLRQYKSESTGLANIAGRYAAAMALAYETWKDDPRQAPSPSAASRPAARSTSWAAHGRDRSRATRTRPLTATKRSTWADDMEWGAAELFRATGERRYLDEARRYAQMAGSETWMGREQAKHYQFYPFMNVGHFRLYDLVDADFQRVLAGYYRDGIARCVRAGQTNPYRVGVPFIWCSNNLVVALVTQCHFYERMTGDTQLPRVRRAQSRLAARPQPVGHGDVHGSGQRVPEGRTPSDDKAHRPLGARWIGGWACLRAHLPIPARCLDHGTGPARPLPGRCGPSITTTSRTTHPTNRRWTAPHRRSSCSWRASSRSRKQSNNICLKLWRLAMYRQEDQDS